MEAIFFFQPKENKSIKIIMRRTNSYGNYSQFRTKNDVILKKSKPCDVNQVDLLFKKLQSLTFKKKTISTHLQSQSEQTSRIIQQTEQEDIKHVNEIGKKKLSAIKQKKKTQKNHPSVFQIDLSEKSNKKNINQEVNVQKSFNISTQVNDECATNLTDQPDGNLSSNEESPHKKVPFLMCKSALLSTSNSACESPLNIEKTLDKSSILSQISNIYYKVEQKDLPSIEAKKIMSILKNLNHLLNDI